MAKRYSQACLIRPIAAALLLLAFQVLNAQPVLQWANGVGSTGNELGDGIAVDAMGNSYSVAYFVSTIDADPGPGVQNLSSAGSEDILVRKLDPNGNLVWAKRIGGTLHDRAINIKYDPAGFVYLVGEFSGTVDFNPGTGVFNKTSAGYTDLFILKLDISGNFIWAVTLGSTSYDNCWSLAIDVSGAIYAVGLFGATVDFDPGPGTSLLTSSGTGSGYVLKLDVAGSFVWAKGIGTLASTEIEVDGNGNSYVTGAYTQTADLDPGPGTFFVTAGGFCDFYVEKLDSVGNFCWAVGIGGSNWDVAESIARDGAGNLYVTGYFRETVDFDPGLGTYLVTGAGYYDAFILKLSPAGGFIWAKTWGSAAGEIGFQVELDSYSNVYAVGYFEDTLDFDPGAGIFSLPNAGIGDVFIQKLDSAGNFINAMRLGGSSDDIGTSIAILNNNNIYVTGYFGGTADFDPGPGTTNISTVGGRDAFVAKISQCPSTTATISPTACNTYMAPNGQVYNASGTYTVIILNATGCDSVITINLSLSTTPSQPGTIAGNASVCAGSTQIYSVAPVAGATSYTWTLPGGWTGTSTTNSITVTVGANGGAIGVTADNGCGVSLSQSMTITVTAPPPQPAAIIGATIVCDGNTGIYSIGLVPGATSYSWTLPNGWTGNSTSDTISATSNASSGIIGVYASNSCGSSLPQTLSVAAYSNPNAAYSFATNLLAASFTDLSAGALSWNWDFGDGLTSSVQNPTHTYSNAGTWLACLTATANGCTDSTCHWVAVVSVGNSEAGDQGLTVFPNPSNGEFNIQCSEPAEGYVTDVSGRILFRVNLDTGMNILDLSAYSNDMYFLHVSDGAVSSAIKLVKQE